ncbi:MAG: hypothetical protein M1824_006403 [Vezdaea acicularis]|nr:MAG: hypothetical protein M1824_006403 [Vezdaea acicularis]
MQLPASALVPCVVIISLLVFFVLLVLAITLQRRWQVRQQKRRRLMRRPGLPTEPVRKFTIERGRVVALSNKPTPKTPLKAGGQRNSWWSVRSVPKSQSASPPSQLSTPSPKEAKSYAELLKGGLERTDVGGQIYKSGSRSRALDPTDAAEKGVYLSNSTNAPDRHSHLEVPPRLQHAPDRRYSNIKWGKSGLEVSADKNGYTNGIRQLHIAPFTVENANDNSIVTKAKQPSGVESTQSRKSHPPHSSQDSSSEERPLSIDLERKSSIREVMDTLENAPTRQTSSWTGRRSIVARPAFAFTVAPPSGEPQREEKALPELPSPAVLQFAPHNLLPPAQIKRTPSPRTVDKRMTTLSAIPGSPPDSPLYSPITEDGLETDIVAESPQYPSSRNPKRVLSPRLSLASLGPDFSGFRKSLAPSTTSSLSRPPSPARLSHPNSPTKSNIQLQSLSDNKVPPHASLRRGLSILSTKSFNTLSSADATSVYNVARAIPLVHTPRDSDLIPEPTTIPGSETDEQHDESTLRPPPSPSPVRTIPPQSPHTTISSPATSLYPGTPPTPHTLAAFPIPPSSLPPLPPTLPSTRYKPSQAPCRSNSLQSHKRGSNLPHPSRRSRDSKIPLPSLNSRLADANVPGARSSRLLKAPLSPMTWVSSADETKEPQSQQKGRIGSAEELQWERKSLRLSTGSLGDVQRRASAEVRKSWRSEGEKANLDKAEEGELVKIGGSVGKENREWRTLEEIRAIRDEKRREKGVKGRVAREVV